MVAARAMGDTFTPTMRRMNMSLTKAKQAQPCQVDMPMRSLTHSAFARSAWPGMTSAAKHHLIAFTARLSLRTRQKCVRVHLAVREGSDTGPA
jgi:hypothetical protein